MFKTLLPNSLKIKDSPFLVMLQRNKLIINKVMMSSVGNPPMAYNPESQDPFQQLQII